MVIDENTTSDEIISENAKKFLEGIDKMTDYHKNEMDWLERFGTIEDYSQYQEQRDLESYKSFINSSAYDDIKKVETEMLYQKKLTLKGLRKISAQHEE